MLTVAYTLLGVTVFAWIVHRLRVADRQVEQILRDVERRHGPTQSEFLRLKLVTE